MTPVVEWSCNTTSFRGGASLWTDDTTNMLERKKGQHLYHKEMSLAGGAVR